MPRFFVTTPPVDGEIHVVGDDAKHIARVLRMRIGDSLTICDGQNTDYACCIAEISGDCVCCTVEQSSRSKGEPSVAVTLFMALAKGDKMDFIIQKSVELGVTSIVPYTSARCVSRPDDKTLRKKLERWQKIAQEAAMQSARGCIPVVMPCLSFAQAISNAAQLDMALFLYENEQTCHLQQALTEKNTQTLALMVGPEGGFEPTEAAQAIQAGMQSISLGPRILRCETAPLAALSAVMYQSGNF